MQTDGQTDIIKLIIGFAVLQTRLQATEGNEDNGDKYDDNDQDPDGGGP
jgi:hypothetical protein